MPNFLATGLEKAAHWLRRKASNPSALAGSQWTGTGFVDAYKRNRLPTKNETLAELKNTAFTCASINAAVCATYIPRLYIWSTDVTPTPKCLTKQLPLRTQMRLKVSHRVPPKVRRALKIEEVVDHPLLDLFQQVNDVHNGFDLWELTTFYQETLGVAYWYIETDSMGTPSKIWILPSQNMQPKRDPDSPRLVDYYEYKVGSTTTIYKPQDLVVFTYPDPKDPYTSGLSPLQAAWEQCAISSDYLAFKKATWENSAIPGAVVSPDEVIGEEERDRLEAQWNAKFRRGGAGRALIAESGMKVSVLTHSMGDLAALAEAGKTKEDIANAFHVPLAYFTTNTNLANLEAAEQQHLSLAIAPRLTRRDQKINQRLIPYYDPTGRLFVASDDPVGVDTDEDPTWFDMNMKWGVVTINEVRTERGLDKVPWGDTPWMPLNMAPTDFPAPDRIPPDATRANYARQSGRNTPPARIIKTQQD